MCKHLAIKTVTNEWQNPNARILYGECGAVERITAKEVLHAVCDLWGPSIMCPGSRNLVKPR
jgi:hypothetical protein